MPTTASPVFDGFPESLLRHFGGRIRSTKKRLLVENVFHMRRRMVFPD